MSKRRFSLMFRLKKPKNYVKGNMHVYMRITVDSSRVEVSTNRDFEPARWNPKAGRATGKKEDALTLNAYLDTLQVQVYEVHQKLLAAKELPTAEKIKNILTGKSAERPRMLLEIFQEHNVQMEKLINSNEYAKGTVTHFQTTLRHTKNFISWKYNISDTSIDKVDYAFLNDFEFYLKTEICAHNTAMKYLGDLKKIMLQCVKRGWLHRDPFLGYKMSRKEVLKCYLVEEELNAFAQKEFFTDRLTLVRDIFLFSCYTGLAYADVQKLKRSEIRVGIDGKKWLFIRRKKTDSPSPVPLLPVALKILEEYKKHPKCEKADMVLPVLSNQKMNAYLKEIADLCGIQKELTFHTARYTFATTVTLNNNVPIESVSKMMGHKDLKTTQHYARILNKKVSEDMDTLAKKLNQQLIEGTVAAI